MACWGKARGLPTKPGRMSRRLSTCAAHDGPPLGDRHPAVQRAATTGSAAGAASHPTGDRAQPDQPADDAVDQASSQLLPPDPSVPRRSAARHVRSARRGPLHLDKGAIIGLEYRFAITGTLHAGVHRSMLSKTIQTFARWDPLKQGDSLPVSVSAIGSFEGLNNLRQLYQTGWPRRCRGPSAIGSRCTRRRPTSSAPMRSIRSPGTMNTSASGTSTPTTTTRLLSGLAARVRFSRGGYVVGDYAPDLRIRSERGRVGSSD